MHEVLYTVDDNIEDADGPILLTTMKQDFENDRRQSDWHPDEVYVALEAAGFGEIMDGNWEPMNPMSLEEIEERMKESNTSDVTFTNSSEFKEFMDSFE